jgi:5'-3' exonuclease
VLRSQFDDVEEGVRALGGVVWSMREFEADDALATGAVRFAAMGEVECVRILTPDKDLGQVLSAEKIVQVDRIRRREITEASFREGWGIAPESVPDYLALTGDAADGIPGLDGWGDKSAAAVLGRYLHLEHIPKSAREWQVTVRSAERLSAKLEAHRAEASLYRTLATLKCDVPLPEPLSDLEWKGAPRERFTAWAEKMGAPGLMQQVRLWRER